MRSASSAMPARRRCRPRRRRVEPALGRGPDRLRGLSMSGLTRMNPAPLHVIVLAAGAGTRMKSARPKVLMPLAGRPLLAHVLATARALEPAAIHVVYGHGGDEVQAAFAGQDDLHWVLQAERLGTGHAVEQALPDVPDAAQVLVLYGDVPLIRAETLRGLTGVDG